MNYGKMIMFCMTMYIILWQGCDCVYFMSMCSNSGYQFTSKAYNSNNKIVVVLSYEYRNIAGVQEYEGKKGESLTKPKKSITKNYNITKGMTETGNSTLKPSPSKLTSRPIVNSGRGVQLKQTTSSTTTTKNPSTETRAKFFCECAVTTASDFSLYILKIHPSFASLDVRSKWRLQLGCLNQTYSLADLKGGKMISRNETLCSNSSSVRVGIIEWNSVASLKSLLLALEGTKDLRIACGDQSLTRKESNHGTHSPSIKVGPQNSKQTSTISNANHKTQGSLGQTLPVTVSNSTDTAGLIKRDRIHESSRPSKYVIYLMVLSFICLMLLIVAVALFLLWRRSKLDESSYKCKKKLDKLTEQKSPRQDYHNYEEISDSYLQQQAEELRNNVEIGNASRSKVSEKIFPETRKKSDARSISINAPDRNYDPSCFSFREEESALSNKHHVPIEYSTALDAISVNSRPHLSTPRITKADFNGHLASYEDLPKNSSPNTESSLLREMQARYPVKDVHSMPELSFGCNLDTGLDQFEKSKSHDYCCSNSNTSILWRPNPQTYAYSKLDHSRSVIFLDSSKLATYDGMVNVNVCPTFGKDYHIGIQMDDKECFANTRSGTRDHFNSIRDTLQSGKETIYIQEDEIKHIYEDVKRTNIEQREHNVTDDIIKCEQRRNQDTAEELTHFNTQPTVDGSSESETFGLRDNVLHLDRSRVGDSWSSPPIEPHLPCPGDDAISDHDSQYQKDILFEVNDNNRPLYPVVSVEAIPISCSTTNKDNNDEDRVVMLENIIYGSKGGNDNIQGNNDDEDRVEMLENIIYGSRGGNDNIQGNKNTNLMIKNVLYQSLENVANLDEANGEFFEALDHIDSDDETVMIDNILYHNQSTSVPSLV